MHNQSPLNTTQPEHITWKYEELSFTIMGEIRLSRLDQLRVTIKVEFKTQAIRHNLDLYNDSALEKLIRKCAERFEIGTVYIGKAFGELISKLENHRLEEIKKQALVQDIKKVLTAEQLKTARENLMCENLLEQTIADLQLSGIQGEEENAFILLMAMTSSKMPDPISVVCLAKSGTGKSYLMERVALCIPEEDKREHTQFTGNSFYYYKREEIRNKVFIVKDLEGALSVMFPMRELQSEKRISKTITRKGRDGKLETITLIVEGPVCVIACTTKESIYEDNANRSILIYLDNSKEQDERIMTHQKKRRAGLIDQHKEKEAQQKMQHMQKALEPIRVINPYAMLIDLPQEIFIKRRMLPMLLSFIEAITFYCQYLRHQKADESTGEIYIETHPGDIEWGFKLLRDTLFRKSDELSGAVRDFYEWLQKRESPTFMANEIRQENKMHPRMLNRYLQQLAEYGYVEITGGKKQRTGYVYSLIESNRRKTIEDKIEMQIKAVMQKIWKAYEQKQNLPAGKAGKKK